MDIFQVAISSVRLYTNAASSHKLMGTAWYGWMPAVSTSRGSAEPLEAINSMFTCQLRARKFATPPHKTSHYSTILTYRSQPSARVFGILVGR